MRSMDETGMGKVEEAHTYYFPQAFWKLRISLLQGQQP